MPRMRTRKADTVDAVNVVDRRQQRGKVTRRIVGRLVVIDDLPQELNLLPAAGDRLADVRNDVGFSAHAFVAPRIRDDAERAVVVAAFDNGDVSLDWIAAPGDPERERDVIPRVDVNFSGGCLRRLLDEHWKHLQLLRANDDVYDVPVLFAKERLSFL